MAFLIALMLNAHEFKLKPLVIGIMIIPLAITPDHRGPDVETDVQTRNMALINYLLNGLFGVKVTWLDSDMAFWSILLVDIWQFVPFVALILLRGIALPCPVSLTNPP